MTTTDPALRAAVKRHLGTHQHIVAADHDDLYAALAVAEAAPPEGTRLVLMSEDLALTLGADRVEWNEPDEHGWYTPTLYKAAEAAPLDVVDAAQALVDEWDAAMAGDMPLNGHYQKQSLDRLRAALAVTSRSDD